MTYVVDAIGIRALVLRYYRSGCDVHIHTHENKRVYVRRCRTPADAEALMRRLDRARAPVAIQTK